MRSRWRHHAVLAFVSLLAIGLTVWSDREGSFLGSLSLTTAYLCLVFMAAALCVGPRRVMRTGARALNIYLRRDLGIWAALTGLVHLFVATELSMNPRYMETYVYLSTSGISGELREFLFSWGSIAGFVVGLLVFLLLILSSNRALRLLGSSWWKRLQRVAYPAFILTVLHGFAFQALEARNVLLIGVVILVFIGVLALQIFGFRAVMKNTNR